jgi:NAD(P)-dependent dehydrogenase (short-subunit alcohol dehydrogenase family)
MREGRLNGKVAVVTGSTSGIGEAIACLFAREGAKVVVTGRRTEKGEKVRDDIIKDGGEAIFIKVDVTKDAELERMVAAALEKYGQIDILVNNAGRFLKKSFLEITSEDWDHFVALDARAYFRCMQLVLPHMEKRRTGNIINVTSLFAVKPVADFAMYAFVKAGITHMTRVVALEYADKGIRINALLPGTILTEMTEGNDDNAQIEKEIPMGRYATSEELAYSALYLASDEGCYTTGSSLVADGGWYPN